MNNLVIFSLYIYKMVYIYIYLKVGQDHDDMMQISFKAII